MIDLHADRLRDELRSCLHVERWVAEVAGQAPFSSFDELRSAATRAGSRLSAAEVLEAVASHPRIGEARAAAELGERERAFSAREQASADSDDEEINRALADGNRAYEARFDRIFIIRARGRSRREILDELTRRLGLDDAEELEIVGAQLVEIALLRLEAIFAAPEGSHVSDSESAA
jgi:2-oxo-4-hydroxy-4-carboxy-5-ureidoimidazoline decarboxylase